MNWEAIAAIGEVVGALGVIASLGYLAIQIRQNTRQIRQDIEQGLVDPENWENIVGNQMGWWSNPHVVAYLRSRPGPISKRSATYIESRLAEQGHAA